MKFLEKKVKICYKIFYIAVLLFTLKNPYLHAQNFKKGQHEQSNIQVDWQNYFVIVNAEFKLSKKAPISERELLREQTKEDILQLISHYLENLVVDENRLLKNILASNDEFSREYSLFLETLEMHGMFFRENKIITSMKIPLRGKNGLLARVPLNWNHYNYESLKSNEYVGEAYQRNSYNSEYIKSLSPVKYTGLIIDVRNLDFNVSLSPKIFDQNGKLIYGEEFIPPNAGKRRGIAAFLTNLNNSEVERRVGRRPLLTTAVETSGFNKTNAVLIIRDAARIFDHEETVKNLRKCRVVFLINEKNKKK
ncbi:MAG: hypothetical protein OEZ13_09465 [Spirochaetia bacterium]|nr:hypothetical protein [Spirochaetia bacterium]